MLCRVPGDRKITRQVWQVMSNGELCSTFWKVEVILKSFVFWNNIFESNMYIWWMLIWRDSIQDFDRIIKMLKRRRILRSLAKFDHLCIQEFPLFQQPNFVYSVYISGIYSREPRLFNYHQVVLYMIVRIKSKSQFIRKMHSCQLQVVTRILILWSFSKRSKSLDGIKNPEMDEIK